MAGGCLQVNILRTGTCMRLIPCVLFIKYSGWFVKITLPVLFRNYIIV